MNACEQDGRIMWDSHSKLAADTLQTLKGEDLGFLTAFLLQRRRVEIEAKHLEDYRMFLSVAIALSKGREREVGIFPLSQPVVELWEAHVLHMPRYAGLCRRLYDSFQVLLYAPVSPDVRDRRSIAYRKALTEMAEWQRRQPEAALAVA